MSFTDILNTANELLDKMEDKEEDSNSEAGSSGAKPDDAHVIPTKPAWDNLRLAVQKMALLMEDMLTVDGVPSPLTLKKWRGKIEKIKKLAE